MLTFGIGVIIYGDEGTTLDRCVAAAAVADRMNSLRLGKSPYTDYCWHGMANALDAMGFAVRTERDKVVALDWVGYLE